MRRTGSPRSLPTRPVSPGVASPADLDSWLPRPDPVQLSLVPHPDDEELAVPEREPDVHPTASMASESTKRRSIPGGGSTRCSGSAAPKAALGAGSPGPGIVHAEPPCCRCVSCQSLEDGPGCGLSSGRQSLRQANLRVEAGPGTSAWIARTRPTDNVAPTVCSEEPVDSVREWHPRGPSQGERGRLLPHAGVFLTRQRVGVEHAASLGLRPSRRWSPLAISVSTR